MSFSLHIEKHPLLDLGALAATLPRPLAELSSPEKITDLLRPDAPVPWSVTDATRAAVRDLLRHGGFKPTGRSKPASEYLRAAASENRLGSINIAADVGNAVSLHTGLPISVVDMDALHPPLRVAIAHQGESYVFNASGQTIDLSGLLCLFDDQGPCANAVKDAQRTKTSAKTTRTLCLVWGTKTLVDCTARAIDWYSELLREAGLKVDEVPVNRGE